MIDRKRRVALAGLAGLSLAALPAMPGKANAWWAAGGGWHGGWCCGVGIGITLPPVVVAPPVYAPPPTYFAPPQPVWVPGHYENGYWVPGHWS
jgi:hypothetical protein